MPMKPHCDGCDSVIHPTERHYEAYDGVVAVGPAKHVRIAVAIRLGAVDAIYCRSCFLDALTEISKKLADEILADLPKVTSVTALVTAAQ